MQNKVRQKYAYLVTLIGVSQAIAMDQTQWQEWSGQQDHRMLQKLITSSPFALEQVEWDQKWLFSSALDPWATSNGSQLWGFPYEQSIAVGHGDTINKKWSWKLGYRYERMGWSQDDFVFYKSDKGLERSQSIHLSSLRINWKSLALEGGSWKQADQWTAYVGGSLAYLDGYVHLVDKPQWTARLVGEQRLGDTIGKRSLWQYLPRLGMTGSGSTIDGYQWEQNLFQRYLYTQSLWRGDDQAHALRLNVDPSRFGALILGVSEVKGEWQFGAVIDLAMISFAYADPFERVGGEPWAKDWSFRIHFGLEGFRAKSVQRPGASMPLMPEVTKISKDDRK